MDKETYIRLAQPAATALLAISILSIPLIVKAEYSRGGYSSPVYVYHKNSCN